MSLRVEGVVASVSGRRVLRGVTLEVERGSIVALMGPNGSGKTSLAYTIMGHPRYRVEAGRILVDGGDVTGLPVHERALRGVMLAFQNPVEVPGVKLSTLITAAYNKRLGRTENLTRPDPKLVARVRELAGKLGLRGELLYRDVNVGFSGGERKRSELLQLLVLEPRYAILDEPDSGLDVDGVRVMAWGVRALAEQGAGVLLITHYARILEYVEPDRVVVLVDGRVVDEGGPELARRIEREGYARYTGGGG